jgi:hypothetical protein
MLKKVPSFVLASNKSSTYPSGYACGFFSAAASLDDLFEHPAIIFHSYSKKIRGQLTESLKASSLTV